MQFHWRWFKVHYFSAFFVAGLASMIAQIILDNTKLTPGHITSLYVAFGAFLSFLGLYEKLLDWAGSGASVIIANFGHTLYSSAYAGYLENGFLGIFSGMLVGSSLIITAAIVWAFVTCIFAKPKN